MERKVGLSILLIVITFIICLVLNFPGSIMGSPATVKNAVVTFMYIAIWIFVSSVVLRAKHPAAIKFFLAYWLANLFFIILAALINFGVFNADWALFFILLLFPHWYGIKLFTDDFLITTGIISSISLLFLVASLLSLRKAKSI